MLEHYLIYYYQTINFCFNGFVLFAIFSIQSFQRMHLNRILTIISILSVDPLSNFRIFHQIELFNPTDSDEFNEIQLNLLNPMEYFTDKLFRQSNADSCLPPVEARDRIVPLQHFFGRMPWQFSIGFRWSVGRLKGRSEKCRSVALP